MKILIVEDSPADREILRYLLEDRFQKEAKFREAQTLSSALHYLSQGDIDCVILDLQLPDSAGRETFEKIHAKYPRVPVIVMTNNKDRTLAVDMIKKGAADYVVKNFTDEEELFRRVLFAIEKHRRTVSVPPEEAASVHRLEQAQANLKAAAEEGSLPKLHQGTFETTNAVADLAQRMFVEIQKLSTSADQQNTRLDHMSGIVDKLQLELLDGKPNKLSMQSTVKVLDRRVSDLEIDSESWRDSHQKQVTVPPKVSPKKRLYLIVIISLVLGLVLGSVATTLVHPTQDQGQAP